jgi:hypothetical protein
VKRTNTKWRQSPGLLPSGLLEHGTGSGGDGIAEEGIGPEVGGEEAGEAEWRRRGRFASASRRKELVQRWAVKKPVKEKEGKIRQCNMEHRQLRAQEKREGEESQYAIVKAPGRSQVGILRQGGVVGEKV